MGEALRKDTHKHSHLIVPLFRDIPRNRSMQPIIMKERPLLECLRIIPAHYLWGQIGNEELHACCREPELLTLEIRKTQDLPEIVEPDLYIIRCECGREHDRMLAQPGAYGNSKPEPNVNKLLPEEYRNAL